jgi:hypothetical protein
VHPEPGIVAVWAAAHTREAIFDALRNRRCYGTTGTRVNLQFTVNKAVMGSTINTDSPPLIAFRTSSEATIIEASIIKFISGNKIILKSYYPNAYECEGTYIDEGFTEDASYLLQVNLANSDMALSSPVWVDKVNSGTIV